MCLAQGHNAVTPVRLEPAALRSRVKHSTTEPLRSQYVKCHLLVRTLVNFLYAILLVRTQRFFLHWCLFLISVAVYDMFLLTFACLHQTDLFVCQSNDFGR